jgi:hypothetical protein
MRDVNEVLIALIFLQNEKVSLPHVSAVDARGVKAPLNVHSYHSSVEMLREVAALERTNWVDGSDAVL